MMPTEGPLTDGGLEIFPRGIYDLVMQISREYNYPTIEITESGCGYLDAPYRSEGGQVPDYAAHRRSSASNLGGAGSRDRRRRQGSLLPCMERCSTTSSGTIGYRQRYGLTYIDFRDQKRTVKNSWPLV